MKHILKTTVMSITILFITLIVTTDTINAQSATEKTYVKIAVDGLSCPFCAYGLEKKLKKIGTANDVLIDLDQGEATFNVSKDQKPTEEQLQKIVKDAGFTPKEIIFSETPFKTKKDE